ncbi:hypothetical protein [Acetobacterium bakii]|uniref:Uncharacterized protein n=1 Tax=Acetobacterium bakii TaxID=52689 RepID=A0A0L6TYR4_9FIRM|nr:hypothetical protein [Acetobacterium bakii]KNZ41399.1 hypothetical protein AKG39_12330 [Acetobacterium bakii]
MGKRNVGAPIGNKNALGHGAPNGNQNSKGHGVPLGNRNAVKTGTNEHILNPDVLPYEERHLFNNLLLFFKDRKPAEEVFKYIRAMSTQQITYIKPNGKLKIMPIPYCVMVKYAFNWQFTAAHLWLFENHPWIFMQSDENV